MDFKKIMVSPTCGAATVGAGQSCLGGRQTVTIADYDFYKPGSGIIAVHLSS